MFLKVEWYVSFVRKAIHESDHEKVRYRRIALLPTPYKVLSYVLLKRPKHAVVIQLNFLRFSFPIFQENPALFLPHLLGQMIVFLAKFVNIIALLIQFNFKSLKKIRSLFATMVLMVFNWLQEFCVFRQVLCICDLWKHIKLLCENEWPFLLLA